MSDCIGTGCKAESMTKRIATLEVENQGLRFSMSRQGKSTFPEMVAAYNRITTLENTLRQAREALRLDVELGGDEGIRRRRREALAAIDAVLSGAPVKEE